MFQMPIGRVDEMKSTGVTRKVDELGRLVLPVEIRRRLGIEERDAVEFFVDGDACIIRKFQPACVFCQMSDDTFEYKDKRICRGCAEGLAKMDYESPVCSEPNCSAPTAEVSVKK